MAYSWRISLSLFLLKGVSVHQDGHDAVRARWTLFSKVLDRVPMRRLYAANCAPRQSAGESWRLRFVWVGVHVGYRYNWSILVLMHAIRCWWKLEHGGGVLQVSGSMTKNYPGFWRSMGSETVITKGLFPMYPYECRTYLGNYSKIWQFAVLPSELIVSAGLPADNMCNSLSESSRSEKTAIRTKSC